MLGLRARVERFLRVRSVVALAAIFVWGVGVLVSRGASAAPESTRFVVLTAAGADASTTLDAVHAHLTGLPVDVRVALDESRPALDAPAPAPCAAAAATPTLAVVCIERSPSGERLLYLTEDGGVTTLVRRFAPDAADADAGLEELGIVVRSLVQALLDGGHVGVGAAPPPASRPSRLALRLGYVGTIGSSSIGWQSGIDAEGQWRIAGPWALAARYSFFPSVAVVVPGSSVALVLDRHPLDVAVGLAPDGTIAPEVWLGAWFDAVHRSTPVTAALRATADRLDVTPGMSVAAGIVWSPFARVHVDARAGLDVAFRQVDYVVGDGSGASLSSTTVRPNVRAGLGVDVW